MKTFDFVGKRKIFFSISIIIILLAVVFAAVFGIKLDIQFKGGVLITYSYTGEINKDEFKADVENIIGMQVSIQETTDVRTQNKNFVVSTAIPKGMSAEKQLELSSALETKYQVSTVSTSVVDPVIGKEFLLKCLTAVGFAAILMVLYVALRFKLVGGWVAGTTAVVALFHDVLVVFAVFILFRIPLNDNFIAVVLTILGYSLNDTIVIFDRVRENKKVFGSKITNTELMNKSLNQTLTRSILTTFTTVTAMVVVSVVAYMYNVTSILSFSFPMILGMISGVYSSLCIATPLWVMIQDKNKQ